MYLTDLATACRKSGLKVVEVDGWRSRGHGPFMAVDSIVGHHTAGPDLYPDGEEPSPADMESRASLNVVTYGREDLRGPLCNIYLAVDGTVYIVAAGYAWHAGDVRWSRYANHRSIAIEAEHDGVSSWGSVLYDAFARLCAALAEHYGVLVERVRGHKEICDPPGRKIDPNFNMDRFRDEVDNYLEENEMSWATNLHKWEPGDKNDHDLMPAGQQLNQARGYAKSASDDARAAKRAAKRTERAVEALAEALGPEVADAVREALVDAVVDVEVTVKEGK